MDFNDLKSLEELKNKGIITQEEFDAQKSAIEKKATPPVVQNPEYLKNNIFDWYLLVWKKYAVFDGRSPRAEYWSFILVNFLVSLAISIVEATQGIPLILTMIYSLAVILPSFSVGVRRLHDVGKSGWYFFLPALVIIPLIVVLILSVLIPDYRQEMGAAAVLIGFFLLFCYVYILVLLCKKGDSKANKYGNPVL